MQEPSPEKLAEYSNTHLELLICSYAYEYKRRDPRRARAMAKELVLMMHEPGTTPLPSYCEPYPAADTTKEDEERERLLAQQLWADVEVVDRDRASWDSVVNGGTGSFALKR